MTKRFWMVFGLVLPLAFAAIAAAGGKTAWSAKGQYYETCNCKVSCPCATGQFLPHEGYCDAFMGFHFDKASVGKTKLDGLNVAIAAKFPKNRKVMDAFMKGELDHFAVYLDASANDAQRAAFPQLLAGLFGNMQIKNAKAPAFVPVTVKVDGDTVAIDAGGGKLTANITNIKTGETKTGGKTLAQRISLAGAGPFPWVPTVTQGKSQSFHYADGNTKWDWKERNAFFGEFSTKGALEMPAAAPAPAAK